MTSREPVAGKACRRAARTPLRGSPGAASPPAGGRWRDQPDPRCGSCQGAVTAEFAVALPAVMLLLALLLAGSAAGVTQLRFEEAARAGARALARGEGAAAVDVIVRRLAGESAVSAVADDGGWLSVTVSGRVPGSVGSLVPWTLTARAWARGESSPAASVAPAPDARNHPSVGRRA
ncbi:TadE family type IV pilus minor pilin [Arthrobacter sp. UYCu712]|uniref:TadE family type IV pilus minor pilin n=1 Tax=Arthrobacter sp. UYCu712 TaxID=3156340 RepID=UPI00339534C4